MALVSALRHRLTSPVASLLLVAWSVVFVFQLGGAAWLAETAGLPMAWRAGGAFVLLFATIVAASFGVVHQADHLAQRLGEPYGTLILTLTIVSIEVALIVAVLLGPGETLTIARDSIFAVMMIILNGVLGLCLVAGARRHGGQTYNAQGANAYLSLIVLLGGAALLLPAFGGQQGRFSAPQALGVSLLTALTYGGFLWLQMGSHRHLFVQPPAGCFSGPQPKVEARRPLPTPPASAATPARADRRAVLARSALLLALILPIVLLAHHLAVLVDLGVAASGAPVAVGGVLIAIIVFTPESLTALKAARADQLQRVLNLCLGAFVSTVGLTVPAVLLIGLWAGQPVRLGLAPAEMLLFGLTVLLTAFSFNGQRSSALQGWLHLTLFGFYGLLLFSA